MLKQPKIKIDLIDMLLKKLKTYLKIFNKDYFYVKIITFLPTGNYNILIIY